MKTYALAFRSSKRIFYGFCSRARVSEPLCWLLASLSIQAVQPALPSAAAAGREFVSKQQSSSAGGAGGLRHLLSFGWTMRRCLRDLVRQAPLPRPSSASGERQAAKGSRERQLMHGRRDRGRRGGARLARRGTGVRRRRASLYSAIPVRSVCGPGGARYWTLERGWQSAPCGRECELRK